MHSYSPMILDHVASTEIDFKRLRGAVPRTHQSLITPFHESSAANTDLASSSVPAKPSQHDQLVAQTRKWVAQTFFGTMLKQMRQSPFKTDLSSGGRGGEAFGALLDQHLAEKMARGSGSKLVNSIVRKIEAKQAYGKQSKSGMLAARQATDQINSMRTAGKMSPVIPFGESHVAAGL